MSHDPMDDALDSIETIAELRDRIAELEKENARLRRRNEMMKQTRNEQLFEKLMQFEHKSDLLQEEIEALHREISKQAAHNEPRSKKEES